jgi:hypothetical protein
MTATASALESPFGMRWTTFVTALGIVAAIGVVKRRPDLAIVATVAWAAGYEVTFITLENLYWHPADVTKWVCVGWEAAALGGWIVLAVYLGIRPSVFWTALTAVGFAVWLTTIPGIADGFLYNLPQVGEPARNQPIRLVPELENVITKTTLAVALLLGAWRVQSEPVWSHLARPERRRRVMESARGLARWLWPGRASGP